jgi:translocation and assembly module TamA
MSLVWVLVGCASRALPPGTTDLRVRSVTLEGTTAFPTHDILATLETQASLRPNLRYPRFNPYVLATDIQRVETYYRSRGFLEARVTGYTTGDRTEDGRADIVLQVDEGAPFYIRRFQYEFGDMGQMDPTVLTAGISVGLGTRFDHLQLEAARDLMRRRLFEASYAYATVEVRAYADRAARRVEVYVFVETGPSCTFGDIRVEGNRQIPAEDIVYRLRFRAGQLYRFSRLRLSQVALYEMGSFNFVAVEPQLSDPAATARAWRAIDGGRWEEAHEAFLASLDAFDAAREAAGQTLLWRSAPVESRQGPVEVASLLDQLDAIEVGPSFDPRVPITVTVSENPGVTYRVGGGIGVQAGRSETYVRGRAVYRNAIAPLNQIDVDGRIGYAWLPSLFARDKDIEGVIGRAHVGFSRPHFFRIADIQTRVSYERNLQEDYSFRRPSLYMGLSRRLREFLMLQTGFSVDIMLTDDSLEPTGSSCQAVPDQFRLVRHDATLTADRRDRPLAARQGWYAELGTQAGIDGPIGDFSYFRLTPDVRYYQPMGRRVSTAIRVTAGTLWDFGGDVPRSQCLYLGGGDTVRGFPLRRLSPYEGSTPVGGLSSWMMNVEPRVELARGWLYGVVFMDAGAVTSRTLDFPTRLGGEEGLHLASGGGLRIVTPIGPFRMDLGYRVTQAPQYAEFLRSRLAFFVSIGEAF